LGRGKPAVLSFKGCVMYEKIELMYSPARQGEILKDKITNRFAQIMTHGQFIMGQEVKDIEKKLADFCGAKHAIGCANGTDALTLSLMAIDLKPNDVIFVPSFTYSATPEAICLLGGKPYFIDAEADGFNISLQSLESSIKEAKAQGLKIKGIISVDIFGEPCAYDAIKQIADSYGLKVIADAAQSFGSVYKGKKIGALGDIAATSFFPTKPLGCFGDGGMLFTNDDKLAELLRSLSQHGKGDNKYDIVRIGMNSRLDSLQAAVLLEKVNIFTDEIKKRQELAAYYNEKLRNYIATPKTLAGNESVWAVYTLSHPKRDEIITRLKAKNIPSNIYYPLPLHKQPAYKDAFRASSLENSERYSSQVFCLPMHAYVSHEQREYITANLIEILESV